VSATSIEERLKKGLETDAVVVQDTSGGTLFVVSFFLHKFTHASKFFISVSGCGDFFQVFVASPKFEGTTLVKQHRMVNDLLQKEFSSVHGMTLKTMPLSKYQREQAAAEASSSPSVSSSEKKA
jgi:stress-induced morphogen